MKLTPAHKELIRLLAAAAVERYTEEQQKAETRKRPIKAAAK